MSIKGIVLGLMVVVKKRRKKGGKTTIAMRDKLKVILGVTLGLPIAILIIMFAFALEGAVWWIEKLDRNWCKVLEKK